MARPTRRPEYIDEVRGTRFVLAHFDEGGYFWRRRILRSMDEAWVLSDEGTWMMHCHINWHQVR